MNIPSYTKGPNKGRINQLACQIEGDPKFGDTHPLYPSLRYLQTNRQTGRQQWVIRSAFKDTQHRNRRNALAYYYKNSSKNS